MPKLSDLHRPWGAADEHSADKDPRSREPGRIFPDVMSNQKRNATTRLALPYEHVQRQRRWMRAGFPSLADKEVLESVLVQVISARKANVIAGALIQRFRTFGAVLCAATSELMTVDGMTEAGVVAVKTVREAALHMLRDPVVDGIRLQFWEDLIKYLTARLRNERVEVALVIFLDTHSRVIGDEEIGRGTINHLALYPREIIRRCLQLDAASIILVHNHPGGHTGPSLADKAFTDEVARAANTMNIAVLDHIIVGNGVHFSFRAERLL